MPRRTILVVDDEPLVRELFVDALRAAGHEVLEAAFGVQAIAAARAHRGPLHMLIADLVMPGMDGRAVAENVVALHPEMRVLYVTGRTTTSLPPGDLVLLKPLTPSTLVARVQELLAEGRGTK